MPATFSITIVLTSSPCTISTIFIFIAS
jgi:hypothetical protein